MREVIIEGGDTDTNACIVGGLIGAAIGLKVLCKFLLLMQKLPIKQVTTLLNCELPLNTPKPRMELFYPSRLVSVLPTLIQMAPKILIIEEEKNSKLDQIENSKKENLCCYII